MKAFLTLVLLSFTVACTHVAGVVTRGNGSPARAALFSIGRPTAIVQYGTFPVDANGHFDFSISPTDEDNLYVYDKTNPDATMRLLRRDELSDHMQLRLDSDMPDMDPAFKAYR